MRNAKSCMVRHVAEHVFKAARIPLTAIELVSLAVDFASCANQRLTASRSSEDSASSATPDVALIARLTNSSLNSLGTYCSGKAAKAANTRSASRLETSPEVRASTRLMISALHSLTSRKSALRLTATELLWSREDSFADGGSVSRRSIDTSARKVGCGGDGLREGAGGSVIGP